MDDKWLPYINRRSPGRACETLKSEKLNLLAAVFSPLLSPGRERGKLVRKKSKHSSLFAFPRKAKASIEAEEPSSPKVSCIGQVNTNKNSCGSKTDKRKHYNSHSSLRQSKWASLFSLRRGTPSSPSRGPPCGGSEVSRFGMPSCESSLFCSPVRSCGAPFAKSLILLQECGYKTQITSKSDVQTLVCNDEVSLLMALSACRQGDLGKGSAGSGVSSPNLITSNLHDMETCHTLHTVSYTESKEVTRSDTCESEKTNPFSLSWGIQGQERISVGVSMEALSCKDCESLDPHSALPLNINCGIEVETSEAACLSIVKTPIDDMACAADVSYLSVVEDEESKNSIVQISCEAAMQNWQDCDEGQCEELKGHNLNERHARRVLNSIDRHEWQAQQFYDKIEPKRKPDSLNMFDCLVSSIPAFPQLSERDLHCFLVGKETDSVWDIHIETRNDSALAAFIFLDHSLYETTLPKGTREMSASSQTWMVQSFCDARGGAKFFRSYSATSYRTAITIRRCKSEPRKPY